MTLYLQPFDTANPAGLPGFTIVTAPSGSVGLISTGGVAQSDTTGAVNALATTAPGSADQGAQITLVNSLGIQGVLLRASATGSAVTGYVGRHNGSQVAIQKLVGGTLTTLRVATRTRSAGQVLRLTVVGSTLTLTIDGTTAATITDTSITAAGTTGIRVSEAATIRVDSFYSGTAAEIATAPTGALAADTPPGQVADVRVASTTEDSAALLWSPQVGATDYLPEYRTSSSAPWTAAPPVTDTATTITGLAAGTIYSVRITARNATGPGTPSVAVALSTRIVQARLVRFPLLIEDRIPSEYMPEKFGDLITADQVEGNLPPRLTDANLAGRFTTAGALRPRSQANTTGDLVPVITKYAGNPALNKSQIGLRDIYWPCMIRVPDSVYQANPTLGRWRIYLSTDHDSSTGQVGMMYCNALNPDDPGATWVSWRDANNSAVIFTEGGSSQTETPTVVWNPFTRLFHMLYQIRNGTFQTTKVATSPDGITWTVIGIALANPPSNVAGYSHTGYAKLWLIDGLWVCWSNQGSGTTTSSGVLWYSYDGLRFVRDRRRLRGNLQWTEGTMRTAIGGLFQWRGQLWMTGSATPFTSGATTAEGLTYMAPVNPDLRSLRGRPIYIDNKATQGETSNPALPFQWGTGDDGRLWGAYHSKTATTERISLMVMS